MCKYEVTILIFASSPSTVHVLSLGEEFDESVHSRSSDFFECMYIVIYVCFEYEFYDVGMEDVLTRYVFGRKKTTEFGYL